MTDQDYALAPSASPLPADKGDPVPLAPDAVSQGDGGIQLDAHAEVQLERGRGQLQGASNVSLGKGVLQVVCRDGVLHDIEVCRALEQMLALATGVFGSHLLAVYALHRETLHTPSASIF